MAVRLLVVPWDSARRGERMGAGPEHLLQLGLVDRLRETGHDVGVTVVDPPDTLWRAEIGTAFGLASELSRAVSTAVTAGELPFVLAGNCGTSSGTVSGIRPQFGAGGIGVIWLDAHADFNTPETTRGGFLDGMALSVLTGRSFVSMSSLIPDFKPVREEDCILVGVRSIDAMEQPLLDTSLVRQVSPDMWRSVQSGDANLSWPATENIYLHIDLDALDVSEGHANGYALAGGLKVAEVRALTQRLGADRRVRAVALTAYDPAADTDGRIGRAALDIAVAAVKAIKAS